MSVRARGIKSAQGELNKAMKDVNVESEEMIAVMLMAIAAQTAPFVPVDTSALINSERRKTTMTQKGPIGFIEYGGEGTNARGTPVQEYATYVHDGPQRNWQKPGASNQFLVKGVRAFVQEDLEGIIARYSSK